MTMNATPTSVLSYLAMTCREKTIHIWYWIKTISVLVRVAVTLSFSFIVGGIVRIAEATPPPTWRSFLPLFVVAVFFRVFIAFCAWLEELAWLKARVPMEMKGYDLLFRHVLPHSHSYFADHPTGKISQKISELPWTSMQVFDAFFNELLPSLATLLVFMVALFFIHPALGLIMLLWTPPALLIISITGIRHAQRSTVRASSRGAVSGAIVDAIANNSSIRLFARQNFEVSNLAVFIDKHKKTTEMLLKNNQIIQLVRDLPIALLFAVLMGYGILLYIEGHIALDQFATLLTIAMIAVSNTEKIVNGFIHLVEHFGTIKEGLNLLALPYGILEKANAPDLGLTEGKLEFSRITFTYPDSSAPVLTDFNLTVKAGQKIGLIGKSGAGKSTLFGLILRTHDPASGAILIDGQDIASVTLSSLRSQIALIPQDATLFHRSLLDNIRYGRLDATEEEVRHAAKLAHCEEFINKLPLGYATPVGERGIKLSGGQKQRIAIARALLKNAPILLLDEATSALDSESEHLIQESLGKLMVGRTVIAIAHRLSTISHLNRLIVLADGVIVEDGSHKELLGRHGTYATLWQKQSGGFIAHSENPSEEEPSPEDEDIPSEDEKLITEHQHGMG